MRRILCLLDIYCLDYDKHHGKAFKWVYTPEDQAGTFSLVTPYNGDAWNNWKPVSPEHSKMLRNRWLEHQKAGTLHTTFIAPHKVSQIGRAAGRSRGGYDMEEDFRSHDRPGYLIIGILWGFLVSVPMWALIIWIFIAAL